MTIDAPLDARPAAVPTAPVNSLLTSPILSTLLKLSLPNAIAMFGTALVAVAETSYIGRLERGGAGGGIDPRQQTDHPSDGRCEQGSERV